MLHHICDKFVARRMERILSILLVASTTARKVVVLDDNDWDSIVVTSPPVKITNSRFSPKNNTQKENSIDFDHSRVARHVTACEEGDLKCLYDNQLDETSTHNPQETVDKFLEKYSSVTNVKINNVFRNGTPKAYWNQIEAQQHNHPYDDAKGWVTLDPIPWSTSKVSKWKPENQGDRPWAYGPPQHQQSGNWMNNRPYPSSGEQHSNSWTSNRPISGERPSAAWGLGSNDIITDNKPNEFPLDNNYPTRPGWGSQNPAMPAGYLPPEMPHYTPVQPPAIARPSYPQHYPPTHSQYPTQPPPPPVHQPSYNYDIGRPETSRPPYQWQNNNNNFNSYPSHNGIHTAGGNSIQSSYPHAGHPANYPDTGRGEWVLVSTTKGYSDPQRYHDRQMHVKQVMNMSPAPSIEISSRTGKSKYHENDIDEKYMLAPNQNSQRKADIMPEMGNTVWTVDGVNILQTNQNQNTQNTEQPWREHRKDLDGEELKVAPEMTFKRTVRLTVLPALNNTSTLSHGGMLEVDASPQTVDEAQREAERLKKLQNIAVVNTGRQTLSMVPVMAKSLSAQTDTNRKRAAVIAAVSAGMIPATMAILLPAALGRKRRSADGESQKIQFAR